MERAVISERDGIKCVFVPAAVPALSVVGSSDSLCVMNVVIVYLQVRQDDLKVIPHDIMGVSEWRPTHCVVFPTEVRALSFIGPSARFLAAAAGRFVCLLARARSGFEGHVDDAHVPLHAPLEYLGMSSSVVGLKHDWACVDMLQGHGLYDVHTLAACCPPRAREAAVLVSGGDDRTVSVWDLSKWEAALTAREVLSMWLKMSMHTRVREIAAELLVKAISGDRAVLLTDEKRARRRKVDLRRELQVLEEDGDDMFGYAEAVRDAREALNEVCTVQIQRNYVLGNACPLDYVEVNACWKV